MEPIAISIEKQTLPAQARAPTQKKTPLEGKEKADVKADVKAEKEVDASRLINALEDVRKDLKKIHNVELRFRVHEASGKIMVTVIDESNGEVLRELPSSKILNIAARVDIMMGFLLDQKG